MKKFNQLAKKKILRIFLSSRKDKVAIKFPKRTIFFFFSAENRLGTERVNMLSAKGLQERIALQRPLKEREREKGTSHIHKNTLIRLVN